MLPQMAAHLNREVVGSHAEPEYPVQSAIADGLQYGLAAVPGIPCGSNASDSISHDIN